ncbi:alpha/beta fold hydrolase [Streptomyces flaveus]|uniref:alpha/beta fold hydrolase n=1 Tax=Streptomyces flaveus TaxID=66370 RepID=UPI00332E8B7D
MSDHLTFQLGDFTTQGGATLRGAHLAYTTYGELNADKSNVIVYPTWYSGRHWDNEWLIGPGMALDPAEYFIIVPNMLGNGLSTSPSNTPPPYDRARFPDITVYDQIEAQHKLVTEEFGIERIALVTGWSMGAGQTFQWAVSYPEMVERIAPFCGSPRTSLHNKVFLEGVKAALTADAVYNGGWYDAEKWPTTGLRALARVYAGWGFSQAFYWRFGPPLHHSVTRLVRSVHSWERQLSPQQLGRVLYLLRRPEGSSLDRHDLSNSPERSRGESPRLIRERTSMGEGVREAPLYRPRAPGRRWGPGAEFA